MWAKRGGRFPQHGKLEQAERPRATPSKAGELKNASGRDASLWAVGGDRWVERHTGREKGRGGKTGRWRSTARYIPHALQRCEKCGYGGAKLGPLQWFTGCANVADCATGTIWRCGLAVARLVVIRADGLGGYIAASRRKFARF